MWMVLLKVPTLQVLHLLSLHLWKPTALSWVDGLFLCAMDMCMVLPRGVLNTLPHCSQVLEVLSVSICTVSMMFVLFGNLLLTSILLRLRLRLYASSGGFGKIALHRSLVRRTGCISFSFFFKSGTMGLYVVENITLSPSVRYLCHWV